MANRKLLVVDDEQDILNLYMEAFNSGGYEVTKAKSGEEALAIMHKDFHPVVFSDLNMPGINGLELAKQIRKNWPITILIAVTGYASLFELSDCREAGFEDYFLKPVRLADLLDKAENCFTTIDRWKKR